MDGELVECPMARRKLCGVVVDGAVVWTERLWWMDGIVESHGGRLKRERTTPVDVVGLKFRHKWPIEFSFDAPMSKYITNLDPFMRISVFVFAQ